MKQLAAKYASSPLQVSCPLRRLGLRQWIVKCQGS